MAQSKIPRLSKKEALIFNIMLRTRKEMFGLEMVERSNSLLRRGTIYVTLQRMEEKGLVESRQESRVAPEIGIPRRLYRITGLGERCIRDHEDFAGFVATLVAV